MRLPRFTKCRGRLGYGRCISRVNKTAYYSQNRAASTPAFESEIRSLSSKLTASLTGKRSLVRLSSGLLWIIFNTIIAPLFPIDEIKAEPILKHSFLTVALGSLLPPEGLLVYDKAERDLVSPSLPALRSSPSTSLACVLSWQGTESSSLLTIAPSPHNCLDVSSRRVTSRRSCQSDLRGDV